MNIVEFLTARLNQEQEAWGGVQLFTQPNFAKLCRYMVADIAAKRAIVQRHERAFENCRAHPDDFASKGALLALLGVLKQLALPYAEHPDYDESWRP